MTFSFEYSATVGGGKKPQALHMPDNTFQMIYLKADGTIGAYTTKPNLGLYDSLAWKTDRRLSPDENISSPSLKKVAHYGAYGFWSADGVSSGTDHKFVLYMLPTDISETLIDGSVNYSKDSSVSSASFRFVNLDGSLLHRYRSLVAPNARIDLQLKLGKSKPIDIGKWFIDRVTLSEPGGDISVSARNGIGKLLKEQTFDENTSFSQENLTNNLKAILALAGVESYWVTEINKPWKLSFNPDDTMLQSIEDIISLLSDWKVGETAAGTIGIGPVTDYRFDQPSTYAFIRDKNCWSFDTEYSDEETYARVCVLCKKPEKRLYVDLPPHKLWPLPQHRTLFVDVPDGTSQEDMQSYANNMATLISRAGRVESFTGRFTPQMIVGDEIKMTADGETKVIGIVTTVKHTFGQKGYYTDFTVDSGGRKGKPMLKDYITRLNGKKKSDSVIIPKTT